MLWLQMSALNLVFDFPRLRERRISACPSLVIADLAMEQTAWYEQVRKSVW